MQTNSPEDNLTELKEQMYRKGFGTDHTQEIIQNMNSAASAFSIEHYASMKNGDQMGYRINFNRGGQNDKVYLNDFTAALLKNIDAPGEMREHNFPAKFLITAGEAYRMLKHGLNVAVNKTLFNREHKQYNTWISLDITASKDDFGNYPEKRYHQNYYGGTSFSPKEALLKFQTPIKEVQFSLQLNKLDQQLRKANLVTVLYQQNGQEKKGIMSIDPQNAGAKLYDSQMNLIEAVSLPRQAIKKEIGHQKQPENNANEEIKKKSNQQIVWKKSNYNRGMRH